MIKYWLLLVVALCVAVAVAYLPPPARTVTSYHRNQVIRSDSFLMLPRENEVVWNAYQERATAAGRLRFGRMYARILEMGDSILQGLETETAHDGGFQLTFGPQVSPALRDLIASQLAYVTSEAGPDGHLHPAVVAVVLDTVGDDVDDRSIRFYMPQFVYLLPQEPGQPCVSLVTLGKPAANELARGRMRPGRILGQSPPALLGACAFYARFGAPGSGVESWLRTGEHLTTLFPNWLAPAPFQDRESRLWRLMRLNYYRAYDHPAFVSCASGDREACISAVTTKPHMPPTIMDLRRPERVAIAWERYWYRSYPLGPKSRSFLSDMVTALGEERFQRFWSSEEPVETAFFRAAGVSLEDWTMQWARQQIGVPRRGPAASRASVALSLALAVVFVGGGVAYVARREVG